MTSVVYGSVVTMLKFAHIDGGLQALRWQFAGHGFSCCFLVARLLPWWWMNSKV